MLPLGCTICALKSFLIQILLPIKQKVLFWQDLHATCILNCINSAGQIVSCFLYMYNVMFGHFIYMEIVSMLLVILLSFYVGIYLYFG